MKFMTEQFSEKGITIIALVVSILILLILAGVTTQLTLSKEGIMATASRANTETKKARVKEEIEAAITQLQIEEQVEGIGLDLELIKKELPSVLKGVQIQQEGDKILVNYQDYSFEIENNFKVVEK